MRHSNLDHAYDVTVRVFNWHAHDCFVTKVSVLIHRGIESWVFIRINDIHSLFT